MVYRSFVVRERAEKMNRFLSEENLNEVREAIRDRPTVMFGVYPTGTPYAFVSSGLLSVELFDVLALPLWVRKNGNAGEGEKKYNVFGYDKRNMKDYAAMVFEEDWSANRERNYAIARALREVSSDLNYVIADPFKMYSSEAITRDEFYEMLRGNPEASLTLEDMGGDIKSIVEEMGPAVDRYLGKRGVIVEVSPEGTPFAMGTALHLLSQGKKVEYIQVNKDDDIAEHVDKAGKMQGANLLFFGDTDSRAHCEEVDKAKERFGIKSVSFRNVDRLMKRYFETDE